MIAGRRPALQGGRGDGAVVPAGGRRSRPALLALRLGQVIGPTIVSTQTERVNHMVLAGSGSALAGWLLRD